MLLALLHVYRCCRIIVTNNSQLVLLHYSFNLTRIREEVLPVDPADVVSAHARCSTRGMNVCAACDRAERPRGASTRYFH